MNILLRVIALPFIFGMFAVMNVALTVKGTWFFLKYGGEFMTYLKDDKPTIGKIYQQLKAAQQ